MKTLSLYSELLSLSSPAAIKSKLRNIKYHRLERNEKSIGIFIGAHGRGCGIHPWDNLKKCPRCGGYPWFVGKDGKDFHSGSPYKIICMNEKCNYQSVKSDDVEVCINDWNEKEPD
ncbi:MAG: hypothetical protein NC485_10170 [Ruminococcus flavefaciens]|nr:hypothetical protein [Ruminococcus flavefaciens]MCM1059262.1 hypothetical protein [Eubacterium sp.]